MRHAHIIFLLGFNMIATFSYSMTAENAKEKADHFTASAEQQIVINGHALETVEPGITAQEIQAARDELMRSLSILIDLQFGILAESL